MKIIDTEKVVIKSWCNNPEDGAIEQAKNLANLPFIFRQVCLMPDTHQGYGMPIGGVIATKNVVVPNAVGVDIGCGMLAVKTSLTEITIDDLKNILGMIRKKIPVGFKHNATPTELIAPSENCIVVRREFESAKYQLGTLGGGNHFIEIQKGSDGHIWFMLHSGSRNLGKQVADYYNKEAIKLNELYFSSVPKKWELAFIPLESELFENYIREMYYCLDFALKNRALMGQIIKEIFSEVCHAYSMGEININHNYAELENHFCTNVWVHRKGATSARLGEFGIIPGSQGTKSYIVRGKGNAESFMSCSHGAGRRMGRKEAVRSLDLATEQKRLEDKGILHAIRCQDDLEEAAGAYKDIDIVMQEQADLVDILIELTPLAVIKG